ncbi:MAG: glycoside hydrolase family 3 N-terminal domain-containing protein [Ilumatobacteraceae bacterium]
MTTHDHEPYRDPSRPVGERVDDLLGRMTLDEKLAQLGSVWIFQIADAAGLDADRATPLPADGIGHITLMGGASCLTAVQSAELANDVQRHLLDHTRLGIPALVHEEICSGLMAREATIYPQAIGVASTFRPDHNRHLADTIRRQMRAVGAHQGLSPVLDICRDPRWGRLEETYGEDPHLVSRMGVEFIRGLQGDDLADGVIATAKHFVGYGASEGGMNWAPAHLPERELRDVYLRPFEAAVREAGLASVMNGYHELDGVPCGANRWLLTEVLRGEWGSTARSSRTTSRSSSCSSTTTSSTIRRPPPSPRSPPASTSSCRAPTRSVRRSPTRSGAATSRWPTSTSPSGAPSRPSSGSACSSSRSSTPALSGSRRAPTNNSPSPGRSRTTASCCSRTTASCRSPGRRRSP